jgi:hypothetical protein
MPEWLLAYHQWWLVFWANNPVLFIVAAVVAVALTVWINRMKKRGRG